MDQSNITNKETLLDRLYPALYNTSKFLTDILSPLQNGNGFSTPNSAKFAEEISNVDIQDDEVMLSFDVVSLFTAIPVDKACDYIHEKLLKDETLSSRTSLDSNEIISLLNFVLSNNYFVYAQAAQGHVSSGW